MMTKLKGFLYGKFVKQLFIISLISFFGLLGSSFVNAYEWEFHDVNSSFGVYNEGTFQQTMLSSSAGVLEGGGMFAGKGLIMLQTNAYNLERRYIYFRGVDNQLYAYGNIYGTMSNPSSFEYLRFNNFYRFNSTDFINSDYYYLSQNGELVSATSFYQNSQLKGMMTRFAFLKQNDSNNYTAFCWVYDTLGFSICVKPASAITTTINSVPGLSINPNDFDTSLIGTSPWVSAVPSGTGTNTNVNLNNYNTLYQSYLRKGYNDVLCYGGYGLDDLYLSGQSLSGLEVGSGANVFDLFDTYGSGLHFVDWYNQNDNDYVYFNAFRDGYESVNFLGKSKGLLGLGLVKQIYWKSDNPLIAHDLQIFCNIVINHADEIDNNTWAGSVFDDYINQNKLNQLIGDIGVVVPGSPLDVLWNQYMSGSSSFTGCSSPEECITNGGIDKSIDLAWKTWSIEGLRGNITGLLPWYIVFGFLGIMFLYILRR